MMALRLLVGLGFDFACIWQTVLNILKTVIACDQYGYRKT
jgi:hypothetical protein